MRRVLVSVVLFALPAPVSSASGHAVFHTASFGDGGLVNLGLSEGRPSRDPAFDFDAIITLSETDHGGAVLYRDRERHEASVRCTPPAMVRIGAVDYPVDVSVPSGRDWKHDLWAALCTARIS